MRSKRFRRGLITVFAVLAVFAVACGPAALASMPGQVRFGHAPRQPLGSRKLGALSASTSISALVTLKPQTGLAAYTQAVTTPGSSLYHQFLTVSEFRQRFGAPQSQIADVDSALRAAGLTPGAVSANGLSIPVRATASKFSTAFHTSFERVRLPAGQVAYANTSAPELSSAASPHVQAILGLDSLNPPQPEGLASDRVLAPGADAHLGANVSADGGPTNSCIGEGSVSDVDGQVEGYWNADEIAQAYGLDGYYADGDEGAGQTVALIEFEPTVKTDVTSYESCYGLSSDPPSISYINAGGTPTSTRRSTDDTEAALDIEQVAALAPKANIDVYVGDTADEISDAQWLEPFMEAVDSSSVNIISTSWGACEGANDSGVISSENTLFEQAATEGQTVFSAAGDDGSSDCYQINDSSTPAVNDPASQPYVTGTGGTTLPGDSGSDTTPDVGSQTVWNESANGSGAGGGGISTLWPMPAWQSDASAGLNVINAYSSGTPCGATSGSYCREVPDVSGDGDPYTGYPIYCSQTCADDLSTPASYDGGWFVIGGTSAVAPLWAAFTALVNASASCNNTPIGFANPLLYQAADNATTYANDFTDITSGNNAYSPAGYTGPEYPAGQGYDEASGLGTPLGGPLGTTLCDEADVVTVTTPTGSQTATVGTAVPTVAVTATDSEAHGIGLYAATGLPPGLSINSSTGAITGTPTSAGEFSSTITATASVTGASNFGTISWQVAAQTIDAQPPTVTGVTPASAVPGTSVTITGTDFYGTATVNFGTTPATNPTVVNDTTITATVPDGTGEVDVEVTTPSGTDTLDNAFTFVQPTEPNPNSGGGSDGSGGSGGGGSGTTTNTSTTTSTTPTTPTVTTTASFAVGNQTLTLTTPAPSACTAATAAYSFSFKSAAVSGSKRAKLTLKRVAFYLDKGVAHVQAKVELIRGHRRTVKVTRYVANAISGRASISEALSLKGLKSGVHTLKVIVTYRETITHGGKRKVETVTKTVTEKLRVC